MYTVVRDNLKEHRQILEKLDSSKDKWYHTYLKVIDNVCSTNDMEIEDVKNILG